MASQPTRSQEHTFVDHEMMKKRHDDTAKVKFGPSVRFVIMFLSDLVVRGKALTREAMLGQTWHEFTVLDAMDESAGRSVRSLHH